MIWTVSLSPECDEVLPLMRHPEELRVIGEAIKQFMKDGTGDVEALGSGRFAINAATGVAVVRVDESTKSLHVSRFVLHDPLPYREPLLDDPKPPHND